LVSGLILGTPPEKIFIQPLKGLLQKINLLTHYAKGTLLTPKEFSTA